MKKLFGWLLLLMTAGWTAQAVMLGESVPDLQISEFIKGKPVKLTDLKGKKLAVIHFWGTGCPPCDEAIPALNEYAKKYAGQVQFIAVGSDDPDTIRKYGRLEEFSFPVAADDMVKTADAYLRMSDRLPTEAIIGKDGKLLWIGNHRLLGQTLDEILAGKYDLEAAVDAETFHRKMLEASTKKDYELCLKLVDERLARFPDDPLLVKAHCGFLAFNLNSPEKALADLNQVIARHPKDFFFHELKLNILTRQQNARALHEAYAVIARDFSDQPKLLLQLVEQLMKNLFAENSLRSAHLLARAAYQSDQLTEKVDRGRAAATLARTYYHLGLIRQALKYQKEAYVHFKGTAFEQNAQLELTFLNNVLRLSREIEEAEKQEK